MEFKVEKIYKEDGISYRKRIKWNDEYIMTGDKVKTDEGYIFIVSDLIGNNIFDERDDFVKVIEIVEIVEKYKRMRNNG